MRAQASGTWSGLLLIAIVVVSMAPGLASADIVCPGCPATDATEGLDDDELVSLIASTVFDDGLSLVLLGAFVIVGLPWFVAAVAIAAFFLPRRLRASR